MKKQLLLSVVFASFAALLFTGCEKEDPDAIKMEDVNKGIQIIIGADGKEYQVVDLGLNSENLWAVCNMGATSPEQTGSRFAWGEVEAKEFFSWSNYRWANGDNLNITKYNNDKNHGTVDGKLSLELADEAPAAIMGDGWRIPTSMDYGELLKPANCTKKWCKLNGVGGFLFTSVRKGYEGNSIFIPLSGMLDNNSLRFEGQYGWYWSNEIYYDHGAAKQYDYTQAEAFLLEHSDVDNHHMDKRPRCIGLPIRPIYIGE
ncbi:MAG: hypothetical protein IK038_10755 [Bacteroidaceae bacterium]|nr:hypothetical protein [Bacteroidaceae bacterium]